MNSGKKRLIYYFAEAGLLFGLLIVLVLGFRQSAFMRGSLQGDYLSDLTLGWYRMEDGKRTEFSFSSAVTAEKGDTLILYNDSLGPEDGGKMVSTRAALYQIRIQIGEQELFTYSDDAFPRNAQMKAKLDCCALLPGAVGENPLILTYTFPETGSFFLEKVYLGDSSLMALHHLKEEAFTTFFIVTMLFLGIFVFGLGIYMGCVKLYDPRFMNVAAFLLLCVLWCATDSSQIQNLLGLSPITCVISFYAFMLLAVPMLGFIRNTGKLMRYRCLFWLQISFWINAALQGVLNYLEVFEYVEMLFVTHLLLIVSVTAVYVILTKEYRKTGEKELRIIRSAFSTLSAGGLCALLLYWLWEISYYAAIFESGILIFSLLLLAGVMSAVVSNIRFRTEMAVYQRLAREDRLTGMKNRTAFEEYLAELQKKADTFENVVLIFMDLNQLKNVNDCYGHNAGDELLIAAAHCIGNAFSEEGDCYRIGGDEFCVIIENPKRSEAEWLDLLEAEILTYNKNSRFYMSIAIGISYLRDEQGVIKRISDWKYEADVKMYQNKGRMKRI